MDSEAGAAMKSFAFEVAGNPLSQNRAWRVITIRGRGSLGKTTEAREYQQTIAAAAVAICPARWDGGVRVDLALHFDSMRPDLDGPIKLILDALQGVKPKGGSERIGGCLVNDRQVRELRVVRHLDRKQPRTVVAVHLLDEEAAR